MKLPKRKETLKAYSNRTGIPIEVINDYQRVLNAQRREARKIFKNIGVPVTYGSLMRDIRSYTKGGDIEFFKTAALSGQSWLGDISELYRRNTLAYLENIYQLTSEYAPDPKTFDVIGDIIKHNDLTEMLQFVNAIGTNAISVIYKPSDEDDNDDIGLDFSELRRNIYDWINGGV